MLQVLNSSVPVFTRLNIYMLCQQLTSGHLNLTLNRCGITSSLSGLLFVHVVNRNIILLTFDFCAQSVSVCCKYSLIVFFNQLVVAVWHGGYKFLCQNTHSSPEADIKVSQTVFMFSVYLCKHIFDIITLQCASSSFTKGINTNTVVQPSE